MKMMTFSSLTNQKEWLYILHRDITAIRWSMRFYITVEKNLSGINGVIRPGIVHRIDMNTTGSLLICKNDKAHQILAEQLKEHSITRKYHAIVHGNLKEDTGTVNAPIGRHPTDRKKMSTKAPNGRHAVTITVYWKDLVILPTLSAS